MKAEDKHIVVVSLNAAVDCIIHLPHLSLGRVHRTDRTFTQAGGKGINVARALNALGRRVLVVGFRGGSTGQQIHEDLLQNRIPSILIPIKGNSRTCYIIVDEATKQQTVINEVGPEISATEYQLFYKEVSAHLHNAELLICSGSLPQGIANDCYAQLIELAHMQRVRTLVDATGELLRTALAARPYFAKPNREEAEELLKITISDTNASAAARQIHQLGAEIGLISLGEKGAVAVWEQGEVTIAAPKISVVNAVASGDAFLAGCADALLAGHNVIEMVRYGVAAGAANALIGGARIDRKQVEALLAEVEQV